MNNEYLKDLSQEELLILIRNCSDRDRKHLLERTYKSRYYNLREVNTSCLRILSQMRFHNTPIYLNEVNTIILKLGVEGSRYIKNCRYTEETLSLVIVTEVLDHYNVHYNEDYFIKLYDIDKVKYQNLKTEINLYLNLFFWK